ncbi:MAG: glycoside hydrolase family 3 protein [Chloroflexi bacterium]|nr:glycoside hydrolase family 3 protein [Chloroflexota bacterium]
MSDKKKKKKDFSNPEIPIEARLEDLLNRLSIEEKIRQLSNSAPGIDRLGIPPYNYWNESLHGVARNGQATVFPQGIAMAATWDQELVFRIGVAISDEARAKYNLSLKRNGKTLIYQGLTFWSPNINIFRDPRWGRGQETFGEDPFLTGELGTAYIRGMQGDHEKYLKTAACAKHYAVHSGPESIRHNQNVKISRQELFRTYLPAFKKVVTQAKVEIIMTAYNAVNGTPCAVNKFLLRTILRDDWQFAGHVVTDCDSMNDLPNYFNHECDHTKTTALALIDGCDLVCGCATKSVQLALDQGLISEEEIDMALRNVFRTRFKLGMFDPPGTNPFDEISEHVIDCDDHRNIAHEAAVKSIVLLQNKERILPLDFKNIDSVLIVGPTATSMEVLNGNYHGVSAKMVTVLEGLIKAIPEGIRVQYRMGIGLSDPNNLNLDWAINEAKVSDITIACFGITPQYESEEGDAIYSKVNGDRETIDLPDNQVEYIKRLSATGTKIILCLSAGSPLNVKALRDYVDAILIIWYPGEEGGNAVADIIVGKASPSGKLPITFINSLADLAAFTDYSMEGRTYRFSSENTDYPFGFGLSYSTFSYSDLHLSTPIITQNTSLRGSFALNNIGDYDAEEVSQIYLEYPESAFGIKYQLVGFKRVALESKKSTIVDFEILPEQLLVCDPEGNFLLHPGKHKLIVGGCSPGDEGLRKGTPHPMATWFTIE